MGIGRVVGRGVAAVRREGVGGALRTLAGEVAFLVRHGPATRGLTPSAAAGVHGDGLGHEPARAWQVRRAIQHVPSELLRGAFVDLGCGKGRALLVAAEFPFTRLVGVEVDPHLAGIARAQVRDTGDARYAVETADAASYPIPEDVTVLFLFNPFGRATLDQVLDQVDASLRATPRDVAFVYLNPVHAAAMKERGYRVHWRAPDALVLVRRRGSGPG